MFWNNLSLNKKNALFISALLLVIITMAALFIARLSTTSNEVDNVLQSEELVNVMLQRDIDHLKWINNLQLYVYNVNQKELTVQTDPTK